VITEKELSKKPDHSVMSYLSGLPRVKTSFDYFISAQNRK
jgi:hypothetical protein